MHEACESVGPEVWRLGQEQSLFRVVRGNANSGVRPVNAREMDPTRPDKPILSNDMLCRGVFIR